MTALQNYSNILESIFGIGATAFDVSKDTTNNLIGALNHPEEYEVFKANFTKRLKRLNDRYRTHPEQLKEIIIQANLIADNKNWEGAYAELATYDILNKSTLLMHPVEPNVDIDKNRTFALELGKSESNLDGLIRDIGVYFDVKCFKDNVSEILKGIYREINIFFGIKYIHISEEYALDVPYDDFQLNRANLKDELKTGLWSILDNAIISFREKHCISISCENFKDVIKTLSPELKEELLSAIRAIETSHINSKIINLSYKILWDRGVMSAMRTYHPFRHALNYHKIVFNYANKFIKDRPSLIVFVTFPWYNQVLLNFDEGNKMLYRSLARRVFCQYINDSTAFSVFNSKFKGKQTTFEVTNNLSGIIFLEDNCIKGEDPDSTNVNTYVYLNPNSINPIGSFACDYIHSLGLNDFDDFEYDNY